MDLLARTSGLACLDGDRSGCRGACEHEAGDYLGQHWPRCPVADLEQDDHLQAVLALRQQARLAPLADWPEAYTAGAVQTWMDIEGEIRERFGAAAEEGRDG